MRIAHVTDVHWMVPPRVWDMTPKRAIGFANLFMLGRRHHFQEEVQAALMEHILQLEPDVFLLTGDLTGTALDAEFEKARGALAPVLERFPSLVLPGNHDVYTRGAQRTHRMAEWFSEWMGLSTPPLARLDVGGVVVFGLDPNRPQLLSASGRLPDDQLIALAEALADPTLKGRFVVLCLHYPILDRHGAVYDNASHGLRNASALIEVLEQAPCKPDLVLHGHEHHGFRVNLTLSSGSVPIFDCGSSGYAYMPDRGRAAAMNVYSVADATLASVERYIYDGSGFSPEEGGAYSTGS
jgi:3',5'-cyclic AMP phosphodiesterase CpdA